MCIVSEIMGKAVSRQMRSPLFKNRMSYLGRSGICWGAAHVTGTGSGSGVHGLCLGMCSNSNSACRKQNFSESTDMPHLSPNSQGRQICSKLTLYSFLLHFVPPEPFPSPTGKKSPTEGRMQLPKRGDATKAGEDSGDGLKA